MNRLEVTVGEPVEAHLDRFGDVLTTAMTGGTVTPYFSVGFKNMAQFGEIFTPTAGNPKVIRTADHLCFD